MVTALTVVLDTNVLLSGIGYPASVPGKILAAWRIGSIEVVLSEFILEELRRVLPRISKRHNLTLSKIDDLVDGLFITAEVISPSSKVDSELRDANDQPVLGTLLAGLAEMNVTYLGCVDIHFFVGVRRLA